MDLRKATAITLTIAVISAMAALLVAGLALVLSWAGDAAASAVVGWIAIALGLVWILALLTLLLSVALNQAIGPPRDLHDWEGAGLGKLEDEDPETAE